MFARRPEGAMDRGTVLIVDDDPEVRATLAEYLAGDGFEVAEAANGLEALAHVKRARPRAIVLDLMMPRLGGIDALQRIRGFDPTIGVVVVTGAEDIELHRKALALGAPAVSATPAARSAAAAALGGRGPAPGRPAPAPRAADTPATPPLAKVLVVDGEPPGRAMLGEPVGGVGGGKRGEPARRPDGGPRGARLGPGHRAPRHRHARSQRRRRVARDREARPHDEGHHGQRHHEPRSVQAIARLRRLRLCREAGGRGLPAAVPRDRGDDEAAGGGPLTS